MNLIDELRWRGMFHDMMPGTDEHLQNSAPVSGYIGFDPTAASLHIGNLATIMLLVHLQRAGHRPVALVGGATGMIGDPSGKSAERNLLDETTLRANQAGIKAQLEKFLTFDDSPIGALVVNNYDWFKEFGFLQFLREVGKHLTVNYMMAKDSVKRRISGNEESGAEGLSYTEFSYQLLQGYDFQHLYKSLGVTLQMGASDQWGNITTGTELIRRSCGGEAYALTCPLITKADGGKFGKTEKGNIWLDAERTSPYQFYQFWLNVSDDDAERYIKIFTMLDRETIEAAVAAHRECPEKRELQKLLAREVTVMVHGEKEYETAVVASGMLFGKATTEDLKSLDEKTFLAVFDGVPTFGIDRAKLPLGILDALAVETSVFPSKGEARKMIQQNGFSLNKAKMNDVARSLTEDDIIDGKYILVQKGKKDYYIIIVNG